MSSLAIFGVCAAAAKVCIAATRKGVRYSIDSINWLAESGKRELESLEKALAASKTEKSPVRFQTTTEARQECREIYAKAKKLAAQNPLLARQQDAVAHFLALKGSTLGNFVPPKDAKKIYQGSGAKIDMDKLIQKASQQFRDVTQKVLTDGIREAAANVGFATARPVVHKNGRDYLVMNDETGKAIVTEIATNKDGNIETTVDLVGYTDQSCQAVMDDLLRRLRDKNILLQEGSHHDHFKALGEVLPRIRIRKQLRKSKQQCSEQKKVHQPVRKRLKS